MLKKNHIFGYIEKTYLMQACYPNFFEASNHIEKENTIIWSIVKMYTGTPLEPGVLCNYTFFREFWGGGELSLRFFLFLLHGL